MHTSQRLSTSRSSTFGALTSRCTICEHSAHIATKDGASPDAGMVGPPCSMAHNSTERLKKKRGSSLVRVHDIQAGRHVSENVQHVGDLWTEANMGETACCIGGGLAFMAGPGQRFTLRARR